MDDAAQAQFANITGASTDIAAQYLQLADGAVDAAIELFFANDGAPLESSARDLSRNPPVNAHSPIHVDSDAEDEEPPSISVDDDETMAHNLQQEMYGTQNNNSNGLDDLGYRAPLARTTETLVGPDAFDVRLGPQSVEQMRAAVLGQMNARRQRGSRRGWLKLDIMAVADGVERPGVFNQSNVWSDGDAPRVMAGAPESSSKANALAQMYRPPFELMCRLSWEEAREQGKDEQKWLLVNIQDPSIFDCQLLNRDIWKNSGVVDTVRENFLFLQHSKDDTRAGQYVQYYLPNKDLDSAYPHIAIVDPRTGEQVKVWSGPPAPKAPDFLMQLHEFLDRYSLNPKAKNPVAKRKAIVRPETKVERMTEEQQLEMAMQASLAGSSTTETPADPDDLTKSVGSLMPHDDASSPEMPQSLHASLLISAATPHTEPPPSDPATTRIQFRHPGGRIVRRFLLADPVRRLFEWLRADPPGEATSASALELTFMQKKLIEHLDETIEHAGLKNGTVMIEIVSSES